MKQILEQKIKEAFARLGHGNVPVFSVNAPPDRLMGDYATNAALAAAKVLKMPPRQLAEELGELLEEDETIESVVVEGPGFINFKISFSVLAEEIKKIIKLQGKYGSNKLGSKTKVLVEYFQPNIAKPLHLGHLRTAIIGDSIFKILEFCGYKTASDTHIGDWGTQFGLLLYAYKQWGNDKVIEKDPIGELNKLYVRMNEEIKKEPGLRDRGKAEFVKLEQGDKENRRLWERFSKWSWQEFDKVYELLGIRRADYNWGESFYEDKMPQVLAELETKGLLKESQGAKIVDLEGEGLGTAVIVKSDGGTTYLLRDLATYIYRQKKGFERQLYIVDSRQEHTFRQTFKILQMLGHISNEQEAVHVSYGVMGTEEGAFSTRKGNALGPVELIEQAEDKVLKIIEDKNPDLTEKKKMAHQVAVGAIKYFDLSHNRTSNIVFRWDEVLNFEGSTGPYLQYSHARIKSILRKAGRFARKADIERLKAPEELVLMRRLMKFSEVVESAAVSYMPHYVADYLYKLAGEFNAFYQKVQVLSEQNKDIRSARLVLISAVAQVLENGLGLLGMDAPEEM